MIMEIDAHKASILLVEDNPDDAFLMIRAFRRSDFVNPIVVATDGAAALDLLYPLGGAEPLRPAIVLLDLNLPKLSGLDVLRHIRAQPSTRFLPVIVLTTSSEDTDIAESYIGGANSYVRKPVKFDDFMAATRSLGMFWLFVNQRPADDA